MSVHGERRSVSPAAGEASLPELHRSVPLPTAGNWFRRLFAFAGPAYLVSVGYMDPGNWATDLAGGARFGYQLVWVFLMSNLMAVLLQTLSARLGVVTGKDLAQACRDYYPGFMAVPLWLPCEIAIIACDLAEVLGAAIGLKLLFGVPLLWGVLITALDVLLLLALSRLGMRRMEAFIVVLVATIGVCFAIELLLSKPSIAGILSGFIPRDASGRPTLFAHSPKGLTVLGLDGESLYIAMGILGATVMPHNLYLHSSLVQSRAVERSVEGKREAWPHEPGGLRGRAQLRVLRQRRDPGARRSGLPPGRTLRGGASRGCPPAARTAARHVAGLGIVRGRAALLGAVEHDHRHARGPGRDGGVPPHPDPAVAPALDQPRARDRARRRVHRLPRRERRRRSAGVLPGGAEPPALVRGAAAHRLHQRPREDGRVRESAVGDRSRS
jgi:hypothetical protein